VCAGVAGLARQGVTGIVSGSGQRRAGRRDPGATVTLVSETKGTRSAPVVSNATGDFVFPNITADTYTIRVEMPSFKTLQSHDVKVVPGSTIRVGALTIDVGGATESMDVRGEAPLIQTATGEKSMSIDPVQASSLPLNSRSYIALLSLAPGIAVDPNSLASQLTTGSANTNAPATRIGGGGDGNYMVDGVTTMDPGVNRPASRISAEAISEIKVDTFGYQAEYGRSSGLQINAVTKSGTNQFRGSFYDVERHSSFGFANSQTNILNGDPKPLVDERDWGWTIAGPIGRPGGTNRLFFFYNQEFNPRTVGNAVTRYRMPTALERKGDFLAVHRQPGQPVSVREGSVENRRVQRDESGGVLCRRRRPRPDSSRQPVPDGLNILNWWPSPNIANVPAGQAYNYETKYPSRNCSAGSRCSGWTISPRRTCAAASSISSIRSPTRRSRGSFRAGTTAGRTTTASTRGRASWTTR
jgi:hypothetical protein